MSINHRDTDEPMGAHRLPLLYQLVYCSRATPGVDDDAVQAIIRTAQRRNAESGITGLLVFGSGVFFQWLEGPRAHIAALMDRLHADSRHQDIVTLDSSEEVRERLFPVWDMELVSGEHIRDVLQDALESAQDAASAATLRGLLQRLAADGLAQLADH